MQVDAGVLVDQAASVLKVEDCSWSMRIWCCKIDQGLTEFLITEAPLQGRVIQRILFVKIISTCAPLTHNS